MPKKPNTALNLWILKLENSQKLHNEYWKGKLVYFEYIWILTETTHTKPVIPRIASSYYLIPTRVLELSKIFVFTHYPNSIDELHLRETCKMHKVMATLIKYSISIGVNYKDAR